MYIKKITNNAQVIEEGNQISIDRYDELTLATVEGAQNQYKKQTKTK